MRRHSGEGGEYEEGGVMHGWGGGEADRHAVNLSGDLLQHQAAGGY